MSCYSTNDESTFFNKGGKKVLNFRADFERNDSFNRCLMTNNKETEQRRRFSTRQSLWPRDWGKWLIIRLLMLSGGSMDRPASALKGLIKSLESFQDASLTAALKPAQMSVRIPLGHQHTHIILCLKLNNKKNVFHPLTSSYHTPATASASSPSSLPTAANSKPRWRRQTRLHSVCKHWAGCQRATLQMTAATWKTHILYTHGHTHSLLQTLNWFTHVRDCYLENKWLINALISPTISPSVVGPWNQRLVAKGTTLLILATKLVT